MRVWGGGRGCMWGVAYESPCESKRVRRRMAWAEGMGGRVGVGLGTGKGAAQVAFD